MTKQVFIFLLFVLPLSAKAQQQLRWVNVDSMYKPLPSTVHVYYTDQRIDTAPFRAYYLVADLNDRDLVFTTDTTQNRRLTPDGFYAKNEQPLAIVNGTFFSFETNANLNVVIRKGRTLSFDNHVRALKGRDTLLYAKYLTSAIGISKNRKADVAWIYNPQGRKRPIAFENGPILVKDSFAAVSQASFEPGLRHYPKTKKKHGVKEKWRMQTAIGGGPVLVHNGQARITNNEEFKFPGKGISDKHPRTAMGYTADGKLLILVVEGRNPQAGGASLVQLAEIMIALGCVEALNLDGGGSSCLLVNGKETIKPSDKVQRAVPAVFIIKGK
ncbi:MAG TPA: phosphodiester glycosidase family protein [Flavisolibacter sp.]|nr:phosphodiester glycosidase family protein [Flavisolibacter sp.]